MIHDTHIYRGSRSAFDAAALQYDEEFELHPATKRIRRIVWKMYYRYFRPGDVLLELNCGTGTDAIELASNGMRIVATDASAEMIGQLKKKIHGTAIHALIEPLQLSFHRLDSLRGQQFDGAFSNFGGLNCTNRLADVASGLSLLLKPGKHIVLCLMPRFSLWETLSFLARGKFRKAMRRRQPDGVLADVHGEKVWVRYYNPTEIVRIFSPYFTPVELRGLNIFSPPPSSRAAYRLLGKMTRLLEKIDDAIPADSRLHAYGDHYVIVFQRKSYS